MVTGAQIPPNVLDKRAQERAGAPDAEDQELDETVADVVSDADHSRETAKREWVPLPLPVLKTSGICRGPMLNPRSVWAVIILLFVTILLLPLQPLPIAMNLQLLSLLPFRRH